MYLLEEEITKEEVDKEGRKQANVFYDYPHIHWKVKAPLRLKKNHYARAPNFFPVNFSMILRVLSLKQTCGVNLDPKKLFSVIKI